VFNSKSISIKALGEGVVELCFDREGLAINKLDSASMQDLGRAATHVAGLPGVRGVLVTSAKESFIVGADITEFPPMFSLQEARIADLFATCNAAVNALEDLPVPTVVAINGTALGGGFEVALACDLRVIASTAQVGFPEVSLGIIPGYGGTVRLPRVANAKVAVDWISSGAPSKAAAAQAAGVVDEVVAPEALRGRAIELLREAIVGKIDWRARRATKLAVLAGNAEHTQVFAAAKDKFRKQSAKHQPAALAAIELMERSVSVSRDEAVRMESAAFAKLARTQAAHSLVQIFLNDQQLKKKVKEHAKNARPVRKAAVLGAGIMGGGIAYTSAVRGTPVLMKDIAEAQLELGVSEAKKLLGKQVAGGKMTQEKADGVLASIRPQLTYDGIAEADVVVEAVVENQKVKHLVLCEVEKLVRPDAVLASNTSSLRIDGLATPLARPENFIGMHFFNPVPLMPLVEVIRGSKTSDIAVSTIVGYAASMGKTPIVVKDGAGFLVNRILTPYMLAFLQLVAEGVDFVKIDQVMEQFGWPMGPAYLNDVIGMDTGTHVFSIISDGFPQRIQRSSRDALHLMVESKRLGQKSGLGFYKYEKDPAGKPKKSVADDTYTMLKAVQPNGARDIEPQQIVERLMLAMIAEAAWCLEEGVVATPAELDMALLLGLGLPQYLGGALKYADWLGLQQVVQLSDRYSALAPYYQVPKSLKDRAAKGQRYYP
jgi:3-hydroxyacyl-CoA dehydrogenase / enoyl-CoA hydratase / 3-hydroxybutyryl-CoA epimerase / enoyl-CoA isomerase